MCGGTGVVTTGGGSGQGPTQLLLQTKKKVAGDIAATAPGAAPDLTDPAVLAARRAAARSILSKRGLQSTFLTTPQLGSGGQLGSPTLLGGSGG